jgi:hypothetical protein
VSKTNGTTTVTYVPSPLFAATSQHNATITFNNGTGLVNDTWSFTVAVYSADKLHQYIALLNAPAVFTANAGGHTGKSGDYGIDQTVNGGYVTIPNGSFLNIASSNNILSMSMWVKKYDIDAGSAFWGYSPSSSGTDRGWNVHFPWSNDNIYFDTDGCCDGTTNRISQAINTFGPYDAAGTNDLWWQSWHNLVALDNKGDKQIWIDGQLFLDGTNNGALPTDFTVIYLGYDYGDADPQHAVIDDFAVYSTALSATDIDALYNGTPPDQITAKASLLAYWPFNDASATSAAPTISIARVNGATVITFTGTLLGSQYVEGPYSAVAGASSPYTPAGSASTMFYRAQ